MQIHRPKQVDFESLRSGVLHRLGLTLGIIGLLCSLFVGWTIPIPLAAIMFSVVSLRREVTARNSSLIGITTGITGFVFSLVWLGYYSIVYGILPS